MTADIADLSSLPAEYPQELQDMFTGPAVCAETHVSPPADKDFGLGEERAKFIEEFAAKWTPAGDDGGPNGPLLRWRGAWTPETLYRQDVDERQHFTDGIQALFGRLKVLEFPTEAPGGGKRKFPAYGLIVPGVNTGKDIPILGPSSEAADPRGDTAPYGILRIRHTEHEPTTLGGTRWVARGQVAVTLYRRPTNPGRGDPERIEREQQVAKDLDSTATVIVNLLSGSTEREIPDVASGVQGRDNNSIEVSTKTHRAQARADQDEMENWEPVTPGALVRWRGDWAEDVEYSGDDLPDVPGMERKFRNRLPNGFRADLPSVNAEELGADGGTYRMRVVAPFTYYGPQG